MATRKPGPFTKEELKNMRAVIETALIPVAEELGVSFKLGRCSFSGNNATFKLDVATVDETGRAVRPEAADYVAFGSGFPFNLEQEWLGKTFANHGKTFRVAGLLYRSRKMPVLCECLTDGKGYKFSADAIRRLFGKPANPTLTKELH